MAEEESLVVDEKKLRRQKTIAAIREINEEFVSELDVEQAFALTVLLSGAVERVHQQLLTRPEEDQKKLAELFRKVVKRVTN